MRSANLRSPGLQERVHHQLERARSVLGQVEAAAALAAGRIENVEALLIEALEGDSAAFDDGAANEPSTVPLGTHASAGMPLTRREREVAGLIARAYTNREVANALTITERTAATHVEHILDKLEVASRIQIAAWAARQLGAYCL
jgi:DNA-binding NarL/FixJ family response regulator